MTLQWRELATLAFAAFLGGCGGGGGGGGSTTDTTPDAFSFAARNGVGTSTTVESATVTITGINAPAAISVSGGTYSIGCGPAFTSGPGMISNNQAVCVRQTSAATASTTTTTILTIGGVTGTFTSTTAATDSTPINVSGTITAATGSYADTDVNDPGTPYIANDTAIQAQVVGNPATVGGYVNQPGAGETGRSQVAGDTDDTYRVELAAGQVLTLTIADTTAGDLDLYLMDAAENTVATSEGTDLTETITVPATGTYLIDVYAYRGASNYTLIIGQNIGQGVTAAAVPRLSVLADFVPGELVVRFESGKGSVASRAMQLSAMGMALADDQATADGPVLIKLDESRVEPSSAPRATGQATAALAGREPPWPIAGNATLLRKWHTLKAIKDLGRQPGVRYAEPNYLLKASSVPNDQYYPSQWHYPLINLPQAWDITTGSRNVIVAVVDTGVLLSHPDLQGQLIGGYDFISDPATALDGDGRDPVPDDPGDQCCNGSSSFHGTHVAGTIAAATNNRIGVAGVAWNARIMPLRALGAERKGTGNDIDQAILYAARLPNASGTLPPKRADIINLSLGGPDYSQAEQDVITQARNQGVIIIAAAGNDAGEGNPVNYPAAYAGVVSTGAVAIDKTRAPYSTFNAYVDIAAPGGDMTRDQDGDGHVDGVLSTFGDDSSGTLRYVLGYAEGTSMATPHVAGVVALMKAVNPALTPAQFDSLLASGKLTQDLGPPGRDDQFGHGLVDAYAAVVAAQATPTPLPAKLVVTPTGLNFGIQGTTATLSLINGGSGSLNVTSTSDDANWLIVGAATDPATGLGTRTITVNRSGLAAGTYTAAITLVSTANTIVIPVIMQVGSGNLSANVGHLYVLLIDPATDEALYQTQVSASNGAYRYYIPDVAAGSYILMAGSDYNNDSYICDPGEACGYYPNLDTYSLLQVSGTRTSVNFGVGLNVLIHQQSGAAAGGGGQPRFQGKRVRM